MRIQAEICTTYAEVLDNEIAISLFPLKNDDTGNFQRYRLDHFDLKTCTYSYDRYTYVPGTSISRSFGLNTTLRSVGVIIKITLIIGRKSAILAYLSRRICEKVRNLYVSLVTYTVSSNISLILFTENYYLFFDDAISWREFGVS